MTQGGVRVRGVLKRQVGMFWTVALKSGTVAEGVALSCLTRALTGDGEEDSSTSATTPRAPPPLSYTPPGHQSDNAEPPSVSEPSSASTGTGARRVEFSRRHSAPPTPLSSTSLSSSRKVRLGSGGRSPMSSSENGVILNSGKMEMSKIVNFGSPNSDASPARSTHELSPAAALEVVDSVETLPRSSLPSASWSPASPAAIKDAAALNVSMHVPASLEGKFTPAQVSTFQDLFSYYDKDGSGDISRDELAKVLETLGESVTDSKLDEMIAEVDQDGDGELSWEEFLQVMSLSGASLFRSMVEKVDKKLNPLKPGDEVIMTQGGVRVHVLLKRQVGMFWSVKPAGGGPLVHNVLSSCLTRLLAGEMDGVGNTLPSGEPGSPVSSLPSGHDYGGPSKPAFVPSEDNSIQYSSSHFMHSAITSEDGSMRKKSEMPGGFLDKYAQSSTSPKSPTSPSVGSLRRLHFSDDARHGSLTEEQDPTDSEEQQYLQNRMNRSIRYASMPSPFPTENGSGGSSPGMGSPFINPEKKRILSSMFPGASIKCHPNGKIVITPIILPLPVVSPTSTLPSPALAPQDDEGEREDKSRTGGGTPGSSGSRKYKDSGLEDLIERLSGGKKPPSSIAKKGEIQHAEDPAQGRHLATAPSVPSDNSEAPPTSPDPRRAALRGRLIIAEQMEKKRIEDRTGVRAAATKEEAEDDEAMAAALALLTGVGAGPVDTARAKVRRRSPKAPDQEEQDTGDRLSPSSPSKHTNHLSFSMDLEQPMGVSLTLTGRVVGVELSGQADYAGVQVGDYVVGVGEHGVQSLEQIKDSLKKIKAGLAEAFPATQTTDEENPEEDSDIDAIDDGRNEQQKERRRGERRLRRRNIKKHKERTQARPSPSRFVLIVLERRDGGVPRIELPRGNGLRSYYMVV